MKYTKAELERTVYLQLENLNAMHDLLSILKHQNELLDRINRQLKDEMYRPGENLKPYGVLKKDKMK